MSCITFKSTLCLEIVRLPKIVGALELLAPDIIIWIIAKNNSIQKYWATFWWLLALQTYAPQIIFLLQIGQGV